MAVISIKKEGYWWVARHGSRERRGLTRDEALDRMVAILRVRKLVDKPVGEEKA